MKKVLIWFLVTQYGLSGYIKAAANGPEDFDPHQIQEISAHSYETAVKNLANSVASGSVAYGVCVEKTGMEGTIHANRCKSIRAVHCSDSSDARTARFDIGANVIVLDAVSDPETVLKSFTG